MTEKRKWLRDHVLLEIHSPEIYPVQAWEAFSNSSPFNRWERWKSPLKKKKKQRPEVSIICRKPTNTLKAAVYNNASYLQLYTADEQVTATTRLNLEHKAPQRTEDALTEIWNLYNAEIQIPASHSQYNQKNLHSLQSYRNSIFWRYFVLNKDKYTTMYVTLVTNMTKCRFSWERLLSRK